MNTPTDRALPPAPHDMGDMPPPPPPKHLHVENVGVILFWPNRDAKSFFSPILLPLTTRRSRQADKPEKSKLSEQTRWST
jgi:hypothetical protein